MIIQGDDCVRYEDWLIHTETENVDTSFGRERVSNAVNCTVSESCSRSVGIRVGTYTLMEGRSFDYGQCIITDKMM